MLYRLHQQQVITDDRDQQDFVGYGGIKTQ